ncbi:MAG: helicase HerA domain-containing protein, partial [Promethearchaeota archaeon]
MESWGAESSPSSSASFKPDEIVLACTSLGQPADLKFPLDFVRDKIFLTGITGSGKSWTGGLLMEEINRVGLQFVCFDVLGAHGGLSQLPNVEELSPKGGESVNIKGLIDRLGKEPTSFVIDIS